MSSESSVSHGRRLEMVERLRRNGQEFVPININTRIISGFDSVYVLVTRQRSDKKKNYDGITMRQDYSVVKKKRRLHSGAILQAEIGIRLGKIRDAGGRRLPVVHPIQHALAFGLQKPVIDRRASVGSGNAVRQHGRHSLLQIHDALRQQIHLGIVETNLRF